MPRFRQRFVARRCRRAPAVLSWRWRRADTARRASPARVVVERLRPAGDRARHQPAARHGRPVRPTSCRRRSVRPASGPIDRIGRPARPTVPGPRDRQVQGRRVDGGANRPRCRRSSRTAALSPRPAYANFDIVTIDAAEDAEAVARAFRARSDVEYAQPAYRVHTEFVPNDAFYRTAVELPARSTWSGRGTSSRRPARQITVAVVDTGVAYTNATVQFHAGAFRVDSDGFTEPPDGSGTLYPALGDLTLSFVAATELGPREPVRRAARFHLGRRHAARPRRPRHARQRHDRPADEQRQQRARATRRTAAGPPASRST